MKKTLPSPTFLRCEYLENPIGLDARHPRLSWIPSIADGGQGSYAIEVVDPDGKLAWRSGQVESSSSFHVRYDGEDLQRSTPYRWRVKVWNEKGVASAWSEEALWFTGPEAHGWSISKKLDAPEPAVNTQWLGLQDRSATEGRVFYARKNFTVAGKIRWAVLFTSAQGVYEPWVNGHRVGEHCLAPEWTDYRTIAQYQGFEVSQYLHEGENSLGAIVGAGWFAGQIGLAGNQKNHFYGMYTSFIAQLRIELEDGQKILVGTDGTWRLSSDGPMRSSDLLMGEEQDARRNFDGWSEPDFAAEKWEEPKIFRGPVLVSQPNEPIRITEYLHGEIVSNTKGVRIFDLKQNLVGWIRMRLKGKAGQKITFKYGEALSDDGTLYRANLRTAAQTDTYICSGKGEEIFEPKFTYHGFRYVEVTGLKTEVADDDLIACVVNSDSPQTGSFECSNDMVNRIVRAIDWTQRGNMHSVPTDCPQRDERLGWTGDAQVFAQTAIFNRDMAAFFTKWLRDVRDAQAIDGRFPDFAPHPLGLEARFSGNPGWADAGVIVPWLLYVNYGDEDILREQFTAAKRYIDWVTARNPSGIWLDREQLTPLCYGDWLNSDTFIEMPGYPKTGGEVPKEVFATAYYAYSTELVARMAAVLGEQADLHKYGNLAHRIRAVFNKEFVSETGTILGDTQAGYALALNFDLLPRAKRAKAAKHMVAALARYGGGLSTGIHSTMRMMVELSRAGYHDEAYALLLRKSPPSWGYMVENGATTIWERWDGWVEGRGFQNPSMNSFNHYAIGAVGEWIWRNVAGINPDETSPGYEHFFLKPVPGGDLTWVKAAYQSIRGKISVEWKISEGKFLLDVEVPSEATLVLPGKGSKPIKLSAGGHHFEIPWKKRA